jgi:hypothetical protein
MITINARIIKGSRSTKDIVDEFVLSTGLKSSNIDFESEENETSKVNIDIIGGIDDVYKIVNAIGHPLWQHEWREIKSNQKDTGIALK